MGSEVGQAIVNSVAAQAMEVDYGHVDVTGVSSGGIKPGDVHAAPLVSVNGEGQSVMMVDKGVRSSTATVGMIEPWSIEEDQKLHQLVQVHGQGNWSNISDGLPGRSAMHCRQRWVSQVDPSILKTPWTDDEDRKIVVAQSKLGNRFAEIAKILDGRPRPAVCQRWHSVLHGRAEKMLENMTKEEVQQIADGLQLEELMENPSQDKKRWTQDEDLALQQAVEELGTSNWGEISRRMPARRSSIQCRRRYSNKLDPNVKNDDWTEDEDKKIVAAQSKLGNRWAQISKMLEGRTEDAVGHRWMSVLHAKAERIKMTLTEEDWKFLQCANDIPYRNVKPWTIEEDEKLVRLGQETGGNNWSAVSKELVGRSSRQCRDRFHSKLDPNISKEPWTDEEDRRIAVAQSKFGNQWVKISKYLVGRPEMAVKVRWYTILSQKADKLMQELTDDDYRFAQEIEVEAAKMPEKRKWTDDEDARLQDLVTEYGMGNWSQIATQLPGRSCLQCRNRFVNQVDPTLRKGGWTEDEDKKVVAAQSRLGNSWAKISRLMEGRSESALNGRWYSVLEPRAHIILQDLKPEDFAFLDQLQIIEQKIIPVQAPMMGGSERDRRGWSVEEDKILLDKVKELGTKSWAEIAKFCPGRAPKQCRHRYLNKVDPKLNQSGWTEEEDRIIVAAQSKLGNRFAEIAKHLHGRTESVVSHRWHVSLQPRADKIMMTLTDKDFDLIQPAIAAAQAQTQGGMSQVYRKGWKPWTAEEDHELIKLVEEHGKHNWPNVSKNLTTGTRLPKQCRDRYMNKLDPNLRVDQWIEDEDRKIVAAQSKLGNRWAKISKFLDGRSEVAIKARWYQALQARSGEIYESLDKSEFGFLDGVDDADKTGSAHKDKHRMGVGVQKKPGMPGQMPGQMHTQMMHGQHSPLQHSQQSPFQSQHGQMQPFVSTKTADVGSMMNTSVMMGSPMVVNTSVSVVPSAAVAVNSVNQPIVAVADISDAVKAMKQQAPPPGGVQ